MIITQIMDYIDADGVGVGREVGMERGGDRVGGDRDGGVYTELSRWSCFPGEA